MRFSLGGLSVEIRRSASKPGLVKDDLPLLNERNLDYLRGCDPAELARRVEMVSLPSLDSVQPVHEQLREQGIVVVPDFIDPSELDGLEDVIARLGRLRDDFAAAGGDHQENEEYLIQNGGVRVAGYSNLAGYPKPVVQVRQGHDLGMVDVFNADRLFPELGEVLRPRLESPALIEVLSGAGSALQPRNLNIYLNRNIRRTRGFHVDAYARQVKAFIYLTDVTGLGDGPYTYVAGSHRPDTYRRLNRKLSEDLPNATETPVVPLDRVIPVLGRRGSLIISDQAGFHRGFPQDQGATRCVAVMNYK